MASVLRKIQILAAVFVISILTTTILLTYGKNFAKSSPTSSDDELFSHRIEGFEALPDISDNPPDNYKRNIFFLETSRTSTQREKLFINARQACAVESAAKLNPNSVVYLLFASTGVIKDFRLLDGDTESDRMLQLLNTYPNVNILHFNVNRYVENTPVKNLWTEGLISGSSYPVAHASDVLRLLTLWKYGGIYLDLDVIVIKNIENFPDNFAGAQSDVLMANGVMGFSHFGKGNMYVNKCLHDISEHFDGTQWEFNGPQLITRNIFQYCPQFDRKMLIRFGECEDFRIFPPSSFYLIPYQRWNWLFNETYTNVILHDLEEKSYMIHAWNKLSYNTLIKKEDVSIPYLNLASKYCPGTIQQIDKYF